MRAIGNGFNSGGCRFSAFRIPGILAACAGFVLGVSGAAVASPGAGPDRQAIVALESKWLDALNRADVDRIASVLADDFTRPAPSAGRFIDKTTLLRYYRSHLKRANAGARRMKITSVDIYGPVTIARGIVVVPGTKGARESQLLFTDIFVRRGGAWKAVSAQENTIGPEP